MSMKRIWNTFWLWALIGGAPTAIGFSAGVRLGAAIGLFIGLPALIFIWKATEG